MTTTRLLRLIAPQLATVALMYLLTGAALAAIPLFLVRDLGFGPTVVGLVTGLPFLFAILTRLYSGGFADRHGPKRALMVGLGLATLSGGIGLGAVLLVGQPVAAATVLLIARICLATAEGFVMVGAQTWGLALGGQARSGLIVGWVGTAMFGAMAAGAPIGGVLFSVGGYVAVTCAILLTPLVVMVPLARLQAQTLDASKRLPLGDVARRILPFCVAIAFVGFGYGAIISFSVLLFEARGIPETWAALTLFSVALVAARIFAGGLPDRYGRARVALWSLAVMIGGLMAMALGPGRGLAFGGAFLAGLGYALVYPAIAREALARIPDRNRGAALSVYSSSVYVTLGIGGPILGLLAGAFGVAFVFVFASVMAGVAMVLILRTQSAT